MASQVPFDADREYRLIEQLELRIASANTDLKFETVIQKFLSALILKVGSESVRNRNLAIKVCQHVNSRLKLDNGISLPVESLLKTFRESRNAFVGRFSLIFVEQGLSRLPPGERSDFLPSVLRGSIPETNDGAETQNKMWSIAFDFLLDVLRTWKVPNHATPEDTELRSTMEFSDYQAGVLSEMLTNFISYDVRTKSSWKSIPTSFEPVFEKYGKSRSSVIVPIAKFLFTSCFTDVQRFAAAVLLSVDPNDTASGIADVMFKQCHFDLETDATVDCLLELYDLDRPKLQIKVLSMLSRSQKSTDRPSKLLEIVEQQLFRDSAGLEVAKVRAAVFQYLTWAVRVSNDLEPIKERLQASLREFIELQGWPVLSQASTTAIDLRTKAYESIGLLAAIKSTQKTAHSTVSMDLITWLFTSLRCDTTKDVRASVDEALSRILNVATFQPEDVSSLKTLLLWNVKAEEGDQDPTYYFRTVNSTRYLAIRYANKVLPFDDVDARFIDLIAVGFNDRREVSEEGNRGLDPYWHMTTAKLSTGYQNPVTFSFPSFKNFVTRVFSADDSRYLLQLQSPSVSAAATFGQNLVVYEALNGSGSDVEPGPDWEQKLDALIRNDPATRAKLRQHLTRADDVSLISLVENSIIGMSQGSATCANVALSLVSLSGNRILERLSSDTLFSVQKSTLNNVVQEQASRIFGMITSLSQQSTSILKEAILSCSAWSTVFGQAAVALRGSLLCAGFTLTRIALRSSRDVPTQLTQEVYDLVTNIILGSNDKSIKHAAYFVLGQMCLCLSPTGEFDDGFSKVIDILMADAKKEDEMAVITLGRIAGALYTKDQKSANDLLERMYGLHEVRKAELHFALGEALSTATLGFRSESTLTEFDVDAQKPEYGFHSDLFDKVLGRAIRDSRTTKPSLKKASAIWLLCLIQFCDDASLLKPHLRECQTAFGRLLNDRDEIVQETGSRGLSLVYEKGDKALRDDLVRDLVQSFTGGDAKLSGTVDKETQLFEAGTLPTEGGQSVQTYKDIVSLATEMGDPSLVYRFMNLASNNAIWSSRAAFGRFGLSGILADSTYLTENKKFYPKLFRYRFDPNPNVQRSMEDIWKALVKDSNKVIEDNFDLIMTDLLKSIVSGKEWRARESSCAAISDLIQGREVEKFEKYLDEIWNVAFKVLDDVKESVRVAAMKFCRTLTSMLIRNLEVGEGTARRAVTMMQHAIPFLLQQMEVGSAQEVQQYAVITLLEIVKKSPPRSLRSFAPEILERLLLALSSLEHESINYLHLNADKYGLTAEKLDKMRVSSINSSPVSEAIERCLDSLFVDSSSSASLDNHVGNGGTTTSTVDGDTTPPKDAMQRLEKVFKTAIGLPSKVGVSRVMVTLVVRHHASFRPYADRFVQLTRKYILDRNATISISFSMALGYLVRLASEKEVNETSRYAQRLYFESQELSHRAVAGEIVQSISKVSNDVFMNFATTFLPFAFIGRNDLDSEVSKRFDEPWKDNVGGSRALNLYLSEIVGLISTHITSSLWPIRQACCLAVADLVSSMDGVEHYTEAEARLLWHVVVESLNGKTWSGKEKVISAYPIFVKNARLIWEEQDKQIKAIAMREAKRTNHGYRPHALTALGQVASTRHDLELDKEVLKVLTNVFEEMEDQEDAMEVDGGDDEQGLRTRHADATCVAVVACLFQILNGDSTPEVLEPALDLVRRAHGKSSAKIDAEIYDGARRYITQATREDAGFGGGQGRIPPPAGARRDFRLEEAEAEVKQVQPATAAFSLGLVLALFDQDECARQYASDHETLRRSRVALAKAFAENASLDHRTTTLLTVALKSCLQGERSRPLKLELEKVLNTLDTAL